MSRQVANPAKRRKTTKKSDEINTNPIFPAEVFDLIIGHLDVNELLVCRATCKYFKQAVDRIRIRSLAIAESEDSICEPVLCDLQDHWYDALMDIRFTDRFYFVSNDPVYESHALIRPDTSAGLRMLMNCFNLSELRRLFAVDVPKKCRSYFALLNRLVQLEHLQIGWIEMTWNLSLKLPNLRTLSVAQVNRNAGSRITLATPNLKHLETGSLGDFRFEYPGSVTFLQVQDFDDDDLYRLENLEVLICADAYNLIWFDYDVAEDEDGHVVSLDFPAFEKLKRVDCARMSVKEARGLFERCERYEINFYYCGMKIDDLNEDLGYLLDVTGRKDNLKLLSVEHMFSAYDQLADALYYCKGIRYTKHFLEYFPDRLPENFASKFYGVRELYVARKVENVDYFVQFLKCFRCLKVVWFEQVCLPQDFYDKHSHLFARVYEFQYRHNGENSPYPPVEIDFRFILKFRYLEKFITDKPIGMDLICEAFNTLKFLKRFELENFLNFDLNFRITRTETISEDEFSVQCFNPRRGCPIHKFTSKDKMLQFVKRHFPALSAATTRS